LQSDWSVARLSYPYTQQRDLTVLTAEHCEGVDTLSKFVIGYDDG
jgi:hypothetical protein